MTTVLPQLDPSSSPVSASSRSVVSGSAPGSSRSRKTSTTLAILLALGLGASACGSGSDAASNDDAGATTTVDGTTDATTDSTETASTGVTQTVDGTTPSDKRVRLGSSVLAKTLDPANQANSARFTGSMEISGTGDAGEAVDMSLEFEGAYDLASKSSTMSMDLSSMMEAAAGSDNSIAGMADLMGGPLQLITIGDDAWIQWGLFAMMGVTADQWVEMSPGDVGSLTEGLGASGPTDPTEFLRQLEEANAEIEEVGRETVRGVETTHLKATVELGELAATLPADQAAQLDDVVGSGIDQLPMEFWIGDDGLIYRWSVTMDMSGVPGVDGSGSLNMVYEIFDYGSDVNIVAPDPSLVVSGAGLGF